MAPDCRFHSVQKSLLVWASFLDDRGQGISGGSHIPAKERAVVMTRSDRAQQGSSAFYITGIVVSSGVVLDEGIEGFQICSYLLAQCIPALRTQISQIVFLLG